MTPLREKFIRDLKLKNYCENTIKRYVYTVAKFSRYFKRSPEHISLDEIKQYLYYLKEERGISLSYFKQIVGALRFLYEHTLNKSWIKDRINYPRSPTTIPTVASPEQVQLLIRAVPDARSRMCIAFLYSTAMRIHEALLVRLKDIDSNRMIIRIPRGKGGHPREVPLSKTLLRELRRYYRAYRPKEFLFEDRRGRRLHEDTVRDWCREGARRARLKTVIKPHMLRHSAATRMLETGTDVRILQELLGHKNINSTLRYTHVTSRCFGRVKDPLDTMSAA